MVRWAASKKCSGDSTRRVATDCRPARAPPWVAGPRARDIQKLAMEQPECADEQTAELMQFLQEERLRRAA